MFIIGGVNPASSVFNTMEPAPADIENSNFRFQHHTFRCKSDDPDPFIAASYTRKSLAQWYHASVSLCQSDVTCQILDNKVLAYQNLVDERGKKSINNYADATLVVASAAGKNDTTKWKSGWRTNRSVQSIVNKFTECPGKCSKLRVFEEDLKYIANIKASISQDNQPRGTSGFVPKRPGVCEFGLKEPLQGKSVQRSSVGFGGFHIQQNESGSNNLSRGNSFESIMEQDNVESGSRFGKQPDQQKLFSDRGYELSRSTSDEFGKTNSETKGMFGSSSFGPRGITADRKFHQNSNTFGAKSTGRLKGNSEFVWEGSNRDTSVGLKNVSAGNTTQFRGGMQGGSSFIRENHNGNASGWNRNSAQSGYKNNNQKTQSEAGMSSVSASIFRTARDELAIQNQKKYGGRGDGGNYGPNTGRGGTGVPKRSLGTARRAGVHGKFIPPIKPTDEDDFGGMFGVKQPEMEGETEEEIDERLKNIDPKMVETIRNEIMDIGAPVEWDDIAGLDFAKKTIQEIVVWPLLRPDIFTGLRKPPKGLLLFGPPGTGKTLIGKCIASQSQSTFFSISASSLTSKWIGDGEKMVRALFAVAKVHQPSVVFIDEIDSLLTQRSDTEHESSRRIKTEFLVQLDGAATGDEERILVVGATNRPQELDEAARRRLVKRLYIPLPEFLARKQIVERLMSSERSSLSDEQINEIASLTDGYSGADMKNLCQEASLGPIRSISFSAMHQITPDQVRPITVEDFKSALQRVRASVSHKDLDAYVKWDKTYGMGSGV